MKRHGKQLSDNDQGGIQRTESGWASVGQVKGWRLQQPRKSWKDVRGWHRTAIQGWGEEELAVTVMSSRLVDPSSSEGWQALHSPKMPVNDTRPGLSPSLLGQSHKQEFGHSVFFKAEQGAREKGQPRECCANMWASDPQHLC